MADPPSPQPFSRDVAALVHRLARCPPELIEHPVVARPNRIRVAAVVADLLAELGAPPWPGFDPGPWASRNPEDTNRLRLALVTCWLLHDEAFRGRADLAERARALLAEGLAPLAELVAADRFVEDEDRREELVRLVLDRLGLVPHGETAAQAQDRLAALDSVERHRVVMATRAAEERARLVREELRRKAELEAAAKVSRE